MGIEKDGNSRPLTYVLSEEHEKRVLTQNMTVVGTKCVHTDESYADDHDAVLKLHKRMKKKQEHASQRWKAEFNVASSSEHGA